MARTSSVLPLPAALLGVAAVVAKPPPPVPASRYHFVKHGASVVGVHAAVVDVPAPAAAGGAGIVGRVAQPARPSARSIMEGTHRQSSGSYCTVPRCSSCTSNPYAIAEFLLSCNLCGVPLAGRYSFIYNDKAFCKAECRSRYLAEELHRAREEKRRASSPELKKTTAARKDGEEECKEGSIFFICPLDP